MAGPAPGEPDADRVAPEPGALADYLLEIAGALARYGCPSPRLEAVIGAVAEQEGYVVEAFAMPTSVFITVRVPEGEPLHRMVRVQESRVDLARLTAVDTVFNDVTARRLSMGAGRAALAAIESAPDTHPRWLSLASVALASGAAAVFLRGDWFDALGATAAGLAVGITTSVAGTSARFRYLAEVGAGLVAGVFASLAGRLLPGASREVVVLAALISRVPGMSFTTALSELAQKNLVSGTARATDAFVTLLSLIFGVSAGFTLTTALGVGAASVAPGDRLGLGAQAAALVVASLAFAVAFGVQRRWFGAALASGAIGYSVTALATRQLAAPLAAFVAAASVSLYANAAARLSGRPSQLFQLPGFMLLVPGSFGYIAFEGLMRGDVLAGASKLFDMLTTASALVVGVLAANAALPARKIL
jgi:uncharacterized membrane protein YjjP (DUF1212 family)